MKKYFFLLVSGLIFLGLFYLFSFKENKILINGAGASFPFPLYAKWCSQYNKFDPKAEINYQSIGSGGGIRQLLKKTIDFGASDIPMEEKELEKGKFNILHIPTTIGAVAITYNLPIKNTINLSGSVIAEIYLGNIKKWNDPKILALNSQINLPDKEIVIVHRSDGSGTTAVFTEFLSKSSKKWKSQVGNAKAIKWPNGIGAKGNEGVTGITVNTPGAIAYVELTYAKSNNLPVAAILNSKGEFIFPNVETISNAVKPFADNLNDDFRISLVNSSGDGAYPISSFTYILSYETWPKIKGKIFKNFLIWIMQDSQQQVAKELHYAPLPKKLTKKIEDLVKNQIKISNP